MFKNINAGLIASRASFLTNRNRLLQTRLIKNSTGDQFYNSNTGYVYHIFTSPGSFEVHTRGRVDVMLVGGGGGGGGLSVMESNSAYYGTWGSGGGGAGGVSHLYNLPLPVSEYNVVIGSGGAAGTPGVFDEDSVYATTNPIAGRGGRGNHTHLVHLDTAYSSGNVPPNAGYERADGAYPAGRNDFFYEWGTRIDPSCPLTIWQEDLYAYSPENIPSNDYRYGTTYAKTAFGGGGGGYTLGDNHAMPANLSPDWYINAYRGGGGGSEGGRGSRYEDDLTTPRLPGINSDPTYGAGIELSREHNEIPQGNIGGGNHRPADDDRNGAGGGGGAGAAGQSGVNSGRGGHGGIGVAAFGNDTGIPSDYGTPGPPSATPNTRWFGGGGQGGDNYVPPSTAGATHGYFGGGGVSVPDNSQTTSYNRTGKTNTGGGGAGARTFNPGSYSPGLDQAGAGGSGIMIIRYQAQL